MRMLLRSRSGAAIKLQVDGEWIQLIGAQGTGCYRDTGPALSSEKNIAEPGAND